MSWLELKLSVRMLVKYPGLTVVGGLAIAFAITIAAAWSEFSHDYFQPTLPLQEGERVVGILNWDVETGSPNARALHDFVSWRERLRTVQEVGAFSTLQRNLITADGRSEPVDGVEISASAFRLVRTPPLLGRPLIEADEQNGAPPVAVIGYTLWQQHFAGDPGVIGRSVRLGDASATVVGVMPEGFAFPVQQRLWVPLRPDVSRYPRGQGPPLQVFGRLAPGATMEAAQSELATIGARAAAEFPETNRHLRPRVRPYVESIIGPMPWQMSLVRGFFVMILAVVCTNVAALVFARTATRENEIAVRRALGASRGRIVRQLFAEALVLASLAAVVGLAVVRWGQGWGMRIFWDVQGGVDHRPFWWSDGLAGTTVLYVAVLTVLGAVLVGVVPALKATGGQLRTRLVQATTGGAGLTFGAFWTGVIVVQVALSVFFLPEAVAAGWQAVRQQSAGLGFPAREYLSVRLEQDWDVPPVDSVASTRFLTRFRATYQSLQQRLATAPGVVSVTVASRFPGMDHGSRPAIEIDGMTGSQFEANTASIDASFFDAFETSILSGRAFRSDDVDSRRDVVIANQSFVREYLGGRNAVGRRLRYAAAGRDAKPGPWYEIVGVAPDLDMNVFNPEEGAGFYQPLRPRAYPVYMAVRVRGGARSFTPQLRAAAMALDPTLRLYAPTPLDELARAQGRGAWFLAAAFAALAIVAMVLSAVGIYSLISFTVARRTREIGVRTALGAHPLQILRAVLARAMAQLGVGVVAGGLGALVFGDQLSKLGPGLFVAVAALMLAVGVLACVLPVRRALGIQPTEALKAGS